jgi:putative SOS response-associated peptidase YedK
MCITRQDLLRGHRRKSAPSHLERGSCASSSIDLLKPYESEEMEMYEANPKVGNVRHNGPEMLKKSLDAAESGTLPF